MFSKISSAVSTGFKVAGITLAVGAVFAFAGAPTLFGMVIITASVIMTVYLYTLLGFAMGFIYKYFFKKDKVNLNETVNPSST